MVKTEKKLQTKQLLSEGQAKISEILDSKGRDVVEADHQASVALAVERMCFHKVGSVVVVEHDMGFVRSIARKVTCCIRAACWLKAPWTRSLTTRK